MKRRALTKAGVVLGVCALGLSGGGSAMAVGSGPHGCFLQDVSGHTLPNVHKSGTSTIGGNSCTMTQVATDEPTGKGGSYAAAAQAWSIKAYKYKTIGKHLTRVPDPAHSFSSAAGSPAVGQHVIPVGEYLVVWVKNGTIIVGTPDGAAGT